jgi:hypothetical protein
MKLVGERRALASAVMAFYFLMYTLLALSGAIPGELLNAIYAIAGVYGLAFFALVAGYFWARWYAVGVGLYGVIVAGVGIWQEGPEYIFLFIGGTHLAATALLWGHAMSLPYDGQTAWRERFHMDDNAVQRLGRSVIRAGVSLPFILLYALAPRETTGTAIAGIVALLLTGLGVTALVRLKTWGVLALAGAGMLMLTLASIGLADGDAYALLRPGVGGALLLTAALPYARPMARFIAR